MNQVTKVMLAGALALVAAPCSAQLPAGAPSGIISSRTLTANRVTLPNGRTWERMQLQYVDAAYVAAVLAGRPLSYRLPMAPYGYGGGYAAFAGMGFGQGYANASRMGNGMAAPFGTGGFGPAFGSAGGGAFGGPGAGAANGGRGGLFPNLVILADPSSNSLLVDP